jgi:hypothetical protein
LQRKEFNILPVEGNGKNQSFFKGGPKHTDQNDGLMETMPKEILKKGGCQQSQSPFEL